VGNIFIFQLWGPGDNSSVEMAPLLIRNNIRIKNIHKKKLTSSELRVYRMQHGSKYFDSYYLSVLPPVYSICLILF
jgi:hypothetical protein